MKQTIWRVLDSDAEIDVTLRHGETLQVDDWGGSQVEIAKTDERGRRESLGWLRQETRTARVSEA